MTTYRVSVVHGWCGDRVGTLVAHLARVRVIALSSIQPIPAERAREEHA